MTTAKYTNAGLVKHAKAALKLNTKYMWGGILRPITSGYISMLRDIYGTGSGTGYTDLRYSALEKLVGKDYYGCDCVGLIKSYYWSGKPDGGTGSPDYGKAGFPDTNAGGMFSAAKIKGDISALPEREGLIVYSKTHPHAGIYIGGGYVIECTLGARGDGVVKTKLTDFGWEYWFECPYISYEGEKTTVGASVKKCILAFPAAVRSKPSAKSEKLGRYTAGSTVTIVTGSETKDDSTGYIYVRLSGEPERWIVKSAVK